MKKKLLFVINTLSVAGAEMAMLALFDALDAEKYDISLYVLMGQGELVNRLPDNVKLLNSNFVPVSVLSAEGRKNMKRVVLRSLVVRGTGIRLFPYLMGNLFGMIKKGRIWADKLLWRVLSEGGGTMRQTGEYDLAVAFLEGGSAYYVADHIKAKKKAAFIHIDYGKAGYNRKLDKDCYLSFDRIFPVSDEVREHFLEAYPECEQKTCVFHNLLNQQKIRELAQAEPGFQDGFSGIRLLTVGRLNWQKGYDVAIDAMKLLKESACFVRWYVLGEGDQRQMLEEKIRKLGLEEDFLLMGAVENPYPYYARADIYVHATRFEGKSIAIQEAQTLGCAILASDCSGNREQIADGMDGRLCPFSPEGIRDGILFLVNHPKERKSFGVAAAKKDIVHREELQLLEELV